MFYMFKLNIICPSTSFSHGGKNYYLDIVLIMFLISLIIQVGTFFKHCDYNSMWYLIYTQIKVVDGSMDIACDDNNEVANEIYQISFFRNQGLH